MAHLDIENRRRRVIIRTSIPTGPRVTSIAPHNQDDREAMQSLTTEFSPKVERNRRAQQPDLFSQPEVEAQMTNIGKIPDPDMEERISRENADKPPFKIPPKKRAGDELRPPPLRRGEMVIAAGKNAPTGTSEGLTTVSNASITEVGFKQRKTATTKPIKKFSTEAEREARELAEDKLPFD